jgi:hypothetical protein
MNAFVSELVLEQHATIDARPRFAVEQLKRETVSRSVRLNDMWDAAYCVRPSLMWAMSPLVPRGACWFETNSREEAERVMQTMLWCGAPTVCIHAYSADRRAETVETWRAL